MNYDVSIFAGNCIFQGEWCQQCISDGAHSFCKKTLLMTGKLYIPEDDTALILVFKIRFNYKDASTI